MKKQILAIMFGLAAFGFLLNANVKAQQNIVKYPCLGFPQYFSVPPGVTTISAVIVGSDGNANGDDVPGGKGAKLTTTIAVTPGNVLTVFSGCTSGYGFTRGGRRRAPKDSDFTRTYWISGGGGSSAILNQNTVLAAAGGGGGASVQGFFGIVQAGKGGDAIVSAGDGGTGGGFYPGAGGKFGSSPTGDGGDGTFGRNTTLGGGGGGGGGYDPNGGGGGGGGRGGGEGAGGGGGGGGKSYVNTAFVTSSTPGLFPGDYDEDGYITISYDGASSGQIIAPCGGKPMTYTVPNQVRALLVTGIGGDGGGYAAVSIYQKPYQLTPDRSPGNEVRSSGAASGYTARISVVPGEQLIYSVGCEGQVGEIGYRPESTNPGGKGGYGFFSGGKGGDGDKPPFLLNYGIGGVGGGGATGIGRSQNEPLFVAPGGGGGGGFGGTFGCYGGDGGAGGGRNGGDASPCANKGLGGLTGDGSPIDGGNACSYCTSGGGGGGGGGYPSGGGGTAGAIGTAGGGGGGGGAFYAAPGSQNVQNFNPEEHRRATLLVTPARFRSDDFVLKYTSYQNGEVTSPQKGILTITPIYSDFAPPVITPSVNANAPDGKNGWYRSSVNVSWKVTSDLPITSQTDCQSSVVSTDTTGLTSNCSATNSVGTTSGSAQTIKRDATVPNITARAVDQNGTVYDYGTTTSVPVTVTFTCTDATSGVATCPAPQTFGSNATVTGTVTDKAGNSRTVTFGNVVSDNQPPTISAINNVETPINTMIASVPFTIGDAETPASQLAVRFNSSNENVVGNGLITLNTDSNNAANRAFEIIPVNGKVGTTIITVDVIDARGAKTTTTFLVSVKCGTITIQQPSPVIYGSSLNSPLYPSGGIAPYDFDIFSGTLPTNLEFDPEFNRLVGGPVGGSAPNSRQIVYKVSDANGCSNPVTVSVNVACLTNPVVTQANNDDVYSLRGMVEGACPNSTITFDGFLQNQEITVDGEISIGKPLTIEGFGADKTTLRSIFPYDRKNRIFNIATADNTNVTIRGVTMTGGNGSVSPGGGIFSQGGNLTVQNSVITANRADYSGGGIAMLNSSSTLNILNSTVSNNIGGGGNNQANGGGIYSVGAVNIVNSTVSGNTAGGQNNIAGGIYAASGLITNSTITDNQVGSQFQTPTNSASGVFGNSANLTVRSSIIAGNRNNTQFPDVFNLFNSGDYNLIGNRGSVTVFNQTGDQTGTSAAPINPLLDILRNNGGTTPTHSFLSMSSPAIDKGNRFGLTTDQRGNFRPYDNPNIPNAGGGDGSDIGAFEVAAPTAAGVAVSGRVLVGSRGLINATVYLTDQTGQTKTARTTAFGYFHFDDVPAGQTYVATVVSKRYKFQPQVVSLTDNLSDLNFAAEFVP